MKQQEFEDVVNKTIDACRDLLLSKNAAYNVDLDKLGTFKKAAVFEGITPEKALWGMHVKHLVSVSDMISSEEAYSMATWDEKIQDAINYFLLLRALLIDTSLQSTTDV